MDKKRLKHFQERLTAKRHALAGVVISTEDYEREAGADTSQDPADIASNAYTKDLLFSQSVNERTILKLVEEALQRLDGGAYGICVNPGQTENAHRCLRFLLLHGFQFCLLGQPDPGYQK